MTRRGQTTSLLKYAPGLGDDVRVVANDRYAAAYPRTPRRRQGTIVAPTGRGSIVRVLWDGCMHSQETDCRLFEAVPRKESTDGREDRGRSAAHR